VKKRLDPRSRREVGILLFAVFVVSLCTISYELMAGALSSSLLGNSVAQYSLTIGIFLASMGLGSWLSRRVRRLLPALIEIELAMALVGGVSLLVLQTVYSFSDAYLPAFILVTGTIGVLAGLEIPILARIVRSYGPMRIVLSSVLTFDYLGGLAASLLFPFLLLPALGLVRTSLVMGLANLAMAVLLYLTYRDRLPHRFRVMRMAAAGVLLGGALLYALPMADFFEQQLYQDRIIFSRRSAFQKIVLTAWRDDLRLYLNDSLQFSSVDEARYHESLVHPAAVSAARLESALVMGGGDGLAVRELLRYPGLRRIVLVDLDPAITGLAREHRRLLALNRHSLHDPRVRIVHRDAFKYLEEPDADPFDLVIADFPDPQDPQLAKLYSRECYRLITRNLSRGGVFVTQSASPFFAREAFWMIAATLESVFPHVLPYHVYVPSFGDWGFTLAAPWPLRPDPDRLPQGLAFLTPEIWQTAQVFPPDSARPAGEQRISTLNRPLLAEVYEKGWKRFN
jgi:spermidine synthase